MQTLTRWLDWIVAKPVVAGLITGVLLLAGTARVSSAAGTGHEAWSDATPAISAPSVRTIAPSHVDAGPRARRHAMPHADGIAASRPETLPAASVTHVTASSVDARGTATRSVHGYDATAPPRLLK